MPKENISFEKTLNDLERVCDEYIATLWRINKHNKGWIPKKSYLPGNRIFSILRKLIFFREILNFFEKVYFFWEQICFKKVYFTKLCTKMHYFGIIFAKNSSLVKPCISLSSCSAGPASDSRYSRFSGSVLNVW